MRDHGCCLTPILQGRRFFFEMWRLNFLVIRVCYVSRSNTLKSWILKKSHAWVLSTVINYTHPARAEITGIWQRIEFFVVKYWHWVKSEANIPKRLRILRTPLCINIWNRKVDFKIASAACAWGSYSKLWHMRVWGHFGAHHRPYSPVVVFTWPMKWFCIVFGCGTCPCHPKLACATTEMWPPGTLNLKIHFTISNIDARKKLKIWACVEFQGASVS